MQIPGSGSPMGKGAEEDKAIHGINVAAGTPSSALEECRHRFSPSYQVD
jgi:hypothetical protein